MMELFWKKIGETIFSKSLNFSSFLSSDLCRRMKLIHLLNENYSTVINKHSEERLDSQP